ncbi:MAG: HDIG domain-containing protein [Clostridia bacterium]|jgi:putative nucleotidyltransferase with HDIG domain|nr:HDIG domain-containing protein [Clostridia bacterium]
MKLTSMQALEMIQNAKGKAKDDHWIAHSICVGNTAGKIAESLGLDVDKAKTLGYIHDIGKSVGEVKQHVMNGYKYIKELGYDEEYANICLTHSYLNNDVVCTAGGIPEEIPFRTEFVKTHEYTIYEKIINLCDLMCKDVTMTIDKRLIDLILRKGVHTNTQYHIKETYKLKEYIDEMLGFNVYNLFPDIVL